MSSVLLRSGFVITPNDVNKLPQEFWDTYTCGEPYGLINLELAKKVGRICDGLKYTDNEIEGVNPCAEIFLPNKATGQAGLRIYPVLFYNPYLRAWDTNFTSLSVFAATLEALRLPSFKILLILDLSPANSWRLL